MLTDLQIKKLALPETRREISDGKIAGLFLVVQPSGAKSWAVRYRVAGTPKKFTIGPYPAVDLATARRRAQEAVGEVAGGNDPAAQKKAVRAARVAEQSAGDRVEAVVDMFVKKYLAKKSKPSWAKEGERLLRVEIVPALGKRRLGEITRADVRRRLEEIAERAPITANRALAIFRKLCNWALSQELIAASPCAGIEPPSPETSRERVLDDGEIRLVWRAFDRVGWPFGPMGKLLLLTGARRNEVGGVRWGELDLAGQVWRIPKERTKNGRPHELPLTDAAVTILKSLPRIDGKEGFVFTTAGATAVRGFSRAKEGIEAAILELLKEGAEARGAVKALERWTFHDLRRTVATNLQRLGVKLEVTEAVLNHVSGSRAGIVGVYQRHEYAAEKRAALEAWGRYLDGLVSGAPAGNVVQFAAGGRA
jgi:integrase